MNQTLSTLSDWCYTSAIAVYLLATGFYAARHATRRSPAAARHGVAAGTVATLTPPPEATGPSRARIGRMAIALNVFGVLLHLGSMVLRGLATQRVPWGNMYEYVSAVCLVAVVAWLVVVRQHRVAQLGVFVLLPITLLLFLAGTVLYTQAAPLQPALRSYWIVIHVSAAVVGSGVFLLSGTASALYLLRDKGVGLARIGDRLPDATSLDRVAYRTALLAFPVLTFAIIAGAIWAEAAWGRYWGWDPKETCAFVSWVCYAAYFHARSTAGWRARRAAWVNVAGCAVVLFNLFFVNLVIAGLHSYAGL
jgi:cytochrome c-type biogenesis protein CcsB